MAKRIFEVLLILLTSIITVPVIIIVLLILFVVDGKPIIYRQKRVGINKENFLLYKFRTMSNDADKTGKLLPDLNRLTILGKILRKTSLDELPSLWNVLKGDMNLVGPRPLLTEYLDRYSPEQARRHEVKPGITGWAQVNGRNTITWNEKFEYDVYYVENHNFIFDLKILFLTIIQVFLAKGVSPEKQEIMSEFLGGDKKGATKQN